MTYRLGTIGLGHWIKRTMQALTENNVMVFHKALGTKPFEERQKELEAYGIPRSRYYTVGKESSEIPADFFTDIDIVQIASHNRFHYDQLIQCLEHDKVTIVEKTLAVNREQFNKLLEFIRDNDYENKVLLHLHYLTKALTKELESILPRLVLEHGKVKTFAATLFEKISEEDKRRGWLFAPENGGIFMDWVHPFTILSKAMNANIGKNIQLQTFIIRPEYDPVNPSGVITKYEISGDNFADNAVADIRFGKGFDMPEDEKKIKLEFEDGSFLILKYLTADEEYQTGKRGMWELLKIENGKTRVIESNSAKGSMSYEILAEEVVNVMEGGKPPLSLDDIEKIYAPQWEYQELVKNVKPVRASSIPFAF